MLALENMPEELHSFHIPVMGIGHSIDAPLRVAHLGISSVISLVDDLLLEKLREYHSQQHGLPYTKIPRNQEDGRAKRITAYLEMVRHIVHGKMETVRQQPFFEKNDKQSYFELLPDESPLKKEYTQLQTMSPGPIRDTFAQSLTSKMKPGAIDVNIMVKVDRTNYDRHGRPLDDEFTDAKAALRGFANSSLRSSVIFSAGMNPKLFTYLSRFRDFYRDACGEMKKKITLKVSDYRSALTQSKFLAKRGLEVSEYRIESGLNCGGHAFPSNGQLLPWILKEFRDGWHQLTESFQSLIHEYYEKMGWTYSSDLAPRPKLSVQGGIGTSGEARRLMEDFGVCRTGWGSPFLLVPEVTNVDDTSRELLRQAKNEDLYLSDMSPLGIPFNTIRGTGSELWTRQQIKEGRPGSPCPKGFAVTNTEFTEKPICLASRRYQKKKLEELDSLALPKEEKERLEEKVLEKTCICDHLGNGILIKLGLAEEKNAPPALCPGPNISWFNGIYTLKELVDHIYGRCASLVAPERPHMFANELVLNVTYFEKLLVEHRDDPQWSDTLSEYKDNLEKGMDLCLEIARKDPFPGENLASIPSIVKQQRARLNSLYTDYLRNQNPALPEHFQEPKLITV